MVAEKPMATAIAGTPSGTWARAWFEVDDCQPAPRLQCGKKASVISAWLVVGGEKSRMDESVAQASGDSRSRGGPSTP